MADFGAFDRTRQRLVKWLMRIRAGEVDALDIEALWPLLDNLLAEAFRAAHPAMNRALARSPGRGALWRQQDDDRKARD